MTSFLFKKKTFNQSTYFCTQNRYKSATYYIFHKNFMIIHTYSTRETGQIYDMTYRKKKMKNEINTTKKKESIINNMTGYIITLLKYSFI